MRGHRYHWARVAAVALLAGGCTSDGAPPAAPPSSGPPPDFRPGAEGIGDPYFPKYGNGGYDVGGYDLKLRYDPKSGQLRGSATVTATATQDLSRFNLDLAHLVAGKVTVDGRAARATADGNELVITPAAGITRGTAFTAVIEYSGRPEALRNEELGVGGWLRTDDGAFALGEPESASTWFPVNDHPADKATFALAMTVPAGVEAISNGVPGERTTDAGWTTWTWTEKAPMASYLATVAIGQYRVSTSTHAGKPMVIAIPESLPADGPAARSMARTGEVADFLATRFGPYPFDAYGGIVLDDDRVGYALETQSRPVYGNTFFRSGTQTTVVAHELAHQWFGDSVALERWKDIWLNEGFASYAEWLWQEHEGATTAEQNFARRYASFDWSEPPGDPGPEGIFSQSVYQRGAMTVHALRKTIGDEAFFRLLKSWPAEQRNGNVTTTEFIAAAEKESGKDLDSLFQAWLFGTTQPPRP
ncbi:M1 family metallopeptidase [Jidongwangia harbinensis]|uniref:M1 family metallopeptidase n=1 Tax=Jidongwangia harbinensis TaxID=2878561 RepID=UPI0035573917